MVIYLDVLIVINLIVNYFIILASVKFLRRKIKLCRILLGSLIGSLFSLYIFLPEINTFFELFVKLLMCLILSSVVFGIKPLNRFLKSSGVIFLITCSYAGLMIAIWKIFKPYGMLINNSVVYFNVSPQYLVVFSVISYFVFLILLKIFGRNNIYASECEICVIFGDKKVDFKAIVDTGNSVSDVFGKSEVIIVDKTIIDSLFPVTADCKTRYRAIPYSSVSNSGILDGYRCDIATVRDGYKQVILKNPIIAASLTPIREEYSGIVNPKIFE